MTFSLILVIQQKLRSPRATGWPLFWTLSMNFVVKIPSYRREKKEKKKKNHQSKTKYTQVYIGLHVFKIQHNYYTKGRPRVPGTPRGFVRDGRRLWGYVPTGGEVVLEYGCISSVIIWAGKLNRDFVRRVGGDRLTLYYAMHAHTKILATLAKNKVPL